MIIKAFTTPTNLINYSTGKSKSLIVWFMVNDILDAYVEFTFDVTEFKIKHLGEDEAVLTSRSK